ncbi:MAG: glutamyl-tRNA reductase [Verrucomicrobia bacterium]|nr:glutamyl-tRNA reductase [Verrucomicrobiota bacterium]
MSAGNFFVLGATHHTAPLAVRERLSLDDGAAESLRAELSAIAGLREFAILNTCNRVEFYGVGPAGIAAEVQRAFCARQQFTPAEFEQFRLNLVGPGALQHLLEVTSGLDSQMLGETEIFGQVKDAYGAAQQRGHTGAVLNRIFQKAFQAAKHVRTHTAINQGQVSVANVAVDLAVNIFGSLEHARILLVGAGEIGEKTARAFQSRGAAALSVSSRNPERAMELANALGAFALPYGLMASKLAEFDIVVCATAAPEPIVAVEAVRQAMHPRPARPLFLIDLALPRDVEAAVADLENVFVYNLDDLAKIAGENRAARHAEIEKCRALLTARAGALWQQVEPRLQAMAQPGDPLAHREEPA